MLDGLILEVFPGAVFVEEKVSISIYVGLEIGLFPFVLCLDGGMLRGRASVAWGRIGLRLGKICSLQSEMGDFMKYLDSKFKYNTEDVNFFKYLQY